MFPPDPFRGWRHPRIRIGRNFNLKILLCSLILFLGIQPLNAQVLSEGYDLSTRAAATGDELKELVNYYGMEVQFKPMRMIQVEVTDPKTGKKEEKLVWYLLYRCVNRPITRENLSSLESPQNAKDETPPSIFTPSFALVTTDGDSPLTYLDEIIPEAVEKINEREGRNYFNTVDVIQEIPKPTTVKDIRDEAIYGVATWQDIDPTTDNFTVLMTGFTNAYQKMKLPDGKTGSVQKLIKQDFWRPGDEFQQDETEIRRKGEPEWVFPGDLIK